MRASRVIFIISVLLLAMNAIAQDDARATIGALERVVNEGTSTRAQQLELARAYVKVGRYYEAKKLAQRLADADVGDAEAIAVRDEAAGHLQTIADQRIADAKSAAEREGATDADRIELANAYFSAGNYREASDIYARIPAASMTWDARHNHARALAWSGRLDSAERTYSAMLAERSAPEIELEYGRVLSWMGASQAAVERLERAHASLSTAETAVALANARAWSSNREGATRLLSEYTAAHPDATEAATLLETMRTSPELRLERLDKLIALEPYNLALRVQRARLLYESERYGEALKAIQFVNEHSPERVADLEELERLTNERRTQRIAELDARMASLDYANPANAQDTLALAKAFTGLGAYPQAIRLYESYLNTIPDDATARINYARILGWDRRYDQAQAQYERVLRDDPDRADVRLEYAQTMSYDEEYVPAIRTFRQLTDISTNPRRHLYTDVPTRAHFNLGQIYRWFGWREHAVREQNSALLLDGDYMPAHEELFRARAGRPATSFDARYTFAENSADFTMQRVDLEGEHWLNQRLAVVGGVGRHNFEHRGNEANATAANIGARYRQSDVLTLRGRVGLTAYDEGLGTRPFWALGAQWLPNIQSRAALDYNHYDLVYDVFTLQSLTTPAGGTGVPFDEPVDIDDFRGHYNYNSGGFWSASGDASYGFISDDNRRAAAHGLLSFRIWNRPFVAIKADGRVLSYDFRSNRYWSPEDYTSLAGVLQVGHNIRDRFFWNIEGKLGRSWEGDRSSDLRSIAAGVTVPMTELLDLVGHYGYGRTGRVDSFTGTGSDDFVNYWQRNWYVGIRVKRLYAGDDRRERNPYYYDNRPLTGSTVLPPEAQ
jgi:tetratricopeptide (TPR) repeat protein